MTSQRKVFKFNRSALNEQPSVWDEIQRRQLEEYQSEWAMVIKQRCESLYSSYAPHRVVCIHDQEGNELYYFQSDTGALLPLMALSKLEITFQNRDRDFLYNMITVTVNQQELHPDIFKPISNPVDEHQVFQNYNQ